MLLMVYHFLLTSYVCKLIKNLSISQSQCALNTIENNLASHFREKKYYYRELVMLYVENIVLYWPLFICQAGVLWYRRSG